MKILEFYKKKKIKDLNNELFILYKELFNLKLKLSLNKLKQTHLIKLCKKKISLIKTFITIKNNE